MIDDKYLDDIIQKLEKAKAADDEEEHDSLTKEAMIQLEMRAQNKKFSSILREEMQDQIAISKLEDRVDHLEESLELWEDFHGEKAEPFLGIYSRQGLKMLKYEISRIKKLREDGHL